MRQIMTIIQNESLVKESIANSNSIITSIWFWISLVEFLIIIFFIIKLLKKKNNLAFSDLSKEQLKKAQSTNVDMDNLMNSINGSKELYKTLSKTCHPDRFINSDKQNLAENIFQEISKNKRNYNKLIALKQRAINELNINL
ncbi:MAG TPA: molecular chaperone DnaJ [Lutibacter sp.]